MARDNRTPDDVRNSVLGARLFYFFMFALFYVCVALYPNKMGAAFTNFNEHILSSFCYLAYVMIVHLTAIWFFLTAGISPGFVDVTTTA
jgi:hypothetical protein